MKNTEIEDLIAFACDRCQCPELVDRIEYSFTRRFRRIAGRATCSFTSGHLIRGRLQFCEKSWPTLNRRGKRNVVIHETCHVIHAWLYGRGDADHGLNWKRLMLRCDASTADHVLTCELKVQHCKPAPHQLPGLVVAYCGCTGRKKLPIWQANRMRQGQRFFCDVCRRSIRLAYA